MIKPCVLIACCFTVVIFVIGFGTMVFFKPSYMERRQKIGCYVFTLACCIVASVISWDALAKAELSAFMESTTVGAGRTSQTVVGSVGQAQGSRTDTDSFRSADKIESINDFFYTAEETEQINRELELREAQASAERLAEATNTKRLTEVKESYAKQASGREIDTDLENTNVSLEEIDIEVAKETAKNLLDYLDDDTKQKLATFKEDLEEKINAYPTDTPEQEVEKIVGMYSEMQSALEGMLDND